jgi:hypothetical protein
VPVNLRDLKLPDVDLIDNLNITDTEIENFSDDEVMNIIVYLLYIKVIPLYV